MKPKLGLKAQIEAEKISVVPDRAKKVAGKGRDGKKALIGYFSPELSKALGRLAVDEETTMQALVGEAVDLLMESRGKHRFGER